MMSQMQRKLRKKVPNKSPAILNFSHIARKIKVVIGQIVLTKPLLVRNTRLYRKESKMQENFNFRKDSKMNNARSYYLGQVSRLFASSKKFTNPVKRSSFAYYLIEAILRLETDKYHHIDNILGEFRKIVGSISRADGLTFLEYYEGKVGQKNKYNSLKDMVVASLLLMSYARQDVCKRLMAQKSAVEIKKDNGKIYVCLNTRYHNCSDSTELTVTANQPKTLMNKVLLFVKTSFTNIYKWLSSLYGLKKGGR